MSDLIKIKVSELIGNQVCISIDDGQKVFNMIEQLIRAEKQITVAFDKVTLVIPLFLNVAIGQLYGSFDVQTIRNQIKVEGLEPDDMKLLKRVVDNAKKYYTNKKAYDTASKDETIL